MYTYTLSLWIPTLLGLTVYLWLQISLRSNPCLCTFSTFFVKYCVFLPTLKCLLRVINTFHYSFLQIFYKYADRFLLAICTTTLNSGQRFNFESIFWVRREDILKEIP